MYDIDIYNQKVEFDNMTYSIDKIRLKTYITYIKFKELEFFINSFYKDNIKKFWISDRRMCFHYNYAIDFESCSFYFAFMHNNEGINYNRDALEYNFTIEFNPNKVRGNSLVLHILDSFSYWFLKSFDLAVDIPINVLDLVFDTVRRRKLQTISYGGDNITYNYGSGNGRVKIYNKKNESNLNIVGNLTRVEVSLEYEDFPLFYLKDFKFNEEVFPCIYLNQYVFSFTDYTNKDKTLMALLYAVQSGYPLKDLTRRYREKVKNMLEGGSRIKFNKQSVLDVFKQTILYYFNRNTSKQVFL